jgi:GAF domain-containing protein
LDTPVKLFASSSKIENTRWLGNLPRGPGTARLPSESSHFSAREDDEVSNFENILAEISTAFVRVRAHQISFETERWLRRIVLALDIDRATVGQLGTADGRLYATHQWARAGVVPIPQALNAIEAVPWLTSKVLAGETVILSRVEDAPAEAAKDLEFARIVGFKSMVAIPLIFGRVVVGAVVFDTVSRAHTWSPRTVQRLRLIAEVFGNALERERAVAETPSSARRDAPNLASRNDGRADGIASA